MALISKTFSLDMTPGAMPPTIHVSEYDINREFTIYLQNAGSAFTPATGTTAKIEGTLNGFGFSEDATISGNAVTFTLTESMTASAGKAWVKVKLTKDDAPVSSAAFILDCDRAGVEADTVIGADGFDEQIQNAVDNYLADYAIDEDVLEAAITDAVDEYIDENGISSEIAPTVTDWLDNNVTPVGSAVVVDSSLSVSGAAADAKAVGDTFDSLLGEETDYSSSFTYVENKYIQADGGVGNNNAFHYVEYVSVFGGLVYELELDSNISGTTYTRVCGYDKNKNFLSELALITTTVTGKTKHSVEIPKSVAFVQISVAKQITIDSFAGRNLSDGLTPRIDSTLKIGGAAADAKAVGDALSILTGETTDLAEDFTYVENKYIASDGSVGNNNEFHYVDYFVVEAGASYELTLYANIASESYTRIAGYDASKAFVEVVELITTTAVGRTSYTITIPSGIEFLRISIAKRITIEQFLGSAARSNIHKFANTPSSCISAFLEKMNAKAARIGMTDSTFVSCSGLTRQNFVTAHDELKMMIEACSYNSLLKVWDKDSWTVQTGGTPVNVNTTVTSASLENYYTLLGGKTGTLDYGSGDLKVVNVCAVCANDYGDIFIGVIIDASSDSARWTAMKQLMDIATAVKHTPNYDVSSASVTDANCAIVCELPQNPAMWQSHTPTILFAQNATSSKAPASTTKVMTVITALDYIVDINETVEIVSADIEAGSGNYFSAGDKITVEDLLFAMMLPSSNTCANALARLAGDYILFIG